jgi:DNA-binding LacI/PurR family transcriptional regulator
MPNIGREMVSDADIVISLWETVARSLRDRIEAGELPPGSRLPSQRDLCKEYGVSRITVRRALTHLADDGVIHTRTGQGTFVSKRKPANDVRLTKSVGLVLRELSNPFFVEVAGGIERHAFDRGFSLLFSNTSGQEGKEEQQIAHFRDLGVDGMIVASMTNEENPPEPVLRMHEAGFPYVLISYVDNPAYRYVGVDHEEGGALAGHYLYQCGYRSFGYLGAEPSNVLGAVRRRGFLRGLEESGAALPDALTLDINLEERWDVNRFEKGYLAADTFLSAPVRPEAMFVYNDRAAYGFIKRLQESGLHIPDDLAVIGFDGIEKNAFFEGTLTTVRQPMEEIGRVVVEVIEKLIAGRSVATRIMVDPALAIGNTTKMKRSVA